MTDGVGIRPLQDGDIAWAESVIGAGFGGRMQALHGELVDAFACPGLVAELDGRPVGLVTYRSAAGSVEIVYLESVAKGAGVGTQLLDAVERETGATCLRVVTTNDNLDALRFYQRRGFRMVEVRPGAVDRARQSVKPSIPEIGRFGIPVGDEIVLERRSDGPGQWSPCRW